MEYRTLIPRTGRWLWCHKRAIMMTLALAALTVWTARFAYRHYFFIPPSRVPAGQHIIYGQIEDTHPESTARRVWVSVRWWSGGGDVSNAFLIFKPSYWQSIMPVSVDANRAYLIVLTPLEKMRGHGHYTVCANFTRDGEADKTCIDAQMEERHPSGHVYRADHALD